MFNSLLFQWPRRLTSEAVEIFYHAYNENRAPSLVSSLDISLETICPMSCEREYKSGLCPVKENTSQGVPVSQ